MRNNGTQRKLSIAIKPLRAISFLGFLVAALSSATAQNTPITRGPDFSPGCLPRDTRMRESCDPRTVVVRTEKEMKFSVELPQLVQKTCGASIEVNFSQWDTLVKVEGTIQNADCAASSGQYKLAVGVRDEHAETKTLEFVESWQRSDSLQVEFNRSYPVGQDVEVVRVRPVMLSCTCADTPSE